MLIFCHLHKSPSCLAFLPLSEKEKRALVNLFFFSSDILNCLQVILEVAPEVLYNELLKKIFRNSLFELSSHHCGNFVVQALISHARHQEQVCILTIIAL